MRVLRQWALGARAAWWGMMVRFWKDDAQLQRDFGNPRAEMEANWAAVCSGFRHVSARFQLLTSAAGRSGAALGRLVAVAEEDRALQRAKERAGR